MIGKEDNALIIFARKPEVGKVKTRLAASIGNHRALDIYKLLLNHTRSVAKAANATTFIFVTETVTDDFWSSFPCELQKGENLGEKMQNAFELIFAKGYKKCVIIGSDCPELSTGIINNAFELLKDHAVVIGGANDGGYYLLGTKKLVPSLFQNKAWSTASVFENTIQDFINENLSYKQLPFLNDLDEEKDIPEGWL